MYLKASFIFILFLESLSLSAFEGSRKPANFVPDDDLIIVPLYVKETNFFEKVQNENKDKFVESRKTLQTWMLNEEYAKNYGIEGRGIVYESTPEERQKFLDRNFLRFFSKKAERTTNEGLKDWWDNISRDEEIDALHNREKRSEYLVKSNKSKTVEKLTKSKTVKVGKEKFKFGFQPRVEMGSAKITVEGFGFEAMAWIGINGNQELYLEKEFSATRTKAFANYYIDEHKLLAVVEQPLKWHTSLRLTHQKDYDFNPEPEDDSFGENNTLQLYFSVGF